MRITRRGLFATLAAAVVGKPAVKGLPLAIVRAFDRHMMGICDCPGCQYARGFIRRGGYDFYPDAFTMVSEPLINPKNTLMTAQEITHKSLQVLENNTKVLPSFYRES